MPEPIIEVRDLHKVYLLGSTKLHALDDVSLSINRGEFVSIVGRSGSGKSTLLNMLAGLERPTRGHITIAGQPIEKMNENKLVRFRLEHIGFIFQSFNLFASMTAVENVSMPLAYRGMSRGQRMARAQAMMKAVGLETHMKHKPNQMSGGQQQRVGIARAFVARPEIVFADEPTGNLDSRTSDEIMAMIQQIIRQTHQTFIMVTHDPVLAAMADRSIHLLDGHIRAN